MNRAGPEVQWPTTQRMVRREDLLSPATQIVADRDAYLGQGRHDVGRRVADDQVELFVAGDVAYSLQREFEQHSPDFIALHDVGTSAALRLLNSLAHASGGRVQRLMIRRQGHGVALAVLQFVELPLANGSRLRLYATDLNSDAASRQSLTRVLLAWSRLGVLLTGDQPAHALSAALKPVHEWIARGPWPNRELLLVPLGSGATLATQASQLTAGSPVAAHVTPTAIRPKQIWAYIGGSWNRLHGQIEGGRAVDTEFDRPVPPPGTATAEATTEPMVLRPTPPAPPPRMAPPAAVVTSAASEPPAAVPTPAPGVAPALAPRAMPTPVGGRWQAYAERCLAIKGAISSCVFDVHSTQPLAFAGGPPSAERLAQQGTALLTAMTDSARALGLGSGRADATLSTAAHHLILRPVPGHPGIALLLVLQASTGNLTLARMQLERIEPPQ